MPDLVHSTFLCGHTVAAQLVTRAHRSGGWDARKAGEQQSSGDGGEAGLHRSTWQAVAAAACLCLLSCGTAGYRKLKDLAGGFQRRRGLRKGHHA